MLLEMSQTGGLEHGLLRRGHEAAKVSETGNESLRNVAKVSDQF